MKTIAINLISFANDRMVGTLVFTRRLLKEWIRHYGENYEIHVYMQNHLSLDVFGIPELNNITIIKVPQFRNSIHRILFEQTLFYRYLKPADIYFSPSLSMPLFAKGKKIVTLHDMIPFINKNKYGIIRNSYVQIFTQLYVKHSDKIITVSSNSKKDIIKYTECNPENIKVVYNFIPKEEKLSATILEELSSKTDIDLSKPFFITVCTLQPGKNLERLIDAFSIFHKENENYRLFIVGGNGWNYESIIDKISKSSARDNIIRLGYRDDAELQMLYRFCEGVVYVSLYEGFGIPPLEGFLFNKICLASNNSSLPEVVGKAGLLVDPYDSNEIAEGLRRLIHEKEAYKHIQEQLTKFDSFLQVSIFNKIIQEL